MPSFSNYFLLHGSLNFSFQNISWLFFKGSSFSRRTCLAKNLMEEKAYQTYKSSESIQRKYH
jgi:hypothetical protein